MAGGGAPGASFDRPGVITLLAVLYFIGGGICLLVAPAVAAVGMGGPDVNGGLLMGFAVFYGLVGLLQVVAAVGLWKLKAYGRILVIASSIIGLLGFPLGTIISILILVYLFKPGIKILFSEQPPSQLSAFELAEVQKVQGSSGAMVALVAVVLILVVVAMIGIIAAIAIPSLLRARVSANEAQTIGDMRSMISAQQTYASANGGYFDSMQCLIQPTGCIPGYPTAAPQFLGQDLTGVKAGYQRTLHLGAPPDAPGSNVSPSSVMSFAFVAVPASPGVTGARAFCGDASGAICVMADGSEPGVVDGMCDPRCPPLSF